jgi:hypothetical protein
MNRNIKKTLLIISIFFISLKTTSFAMNEEIKIDDNGRRTTLIKTQKTRSSPEQTFKWGSTSMGIGTIAMAAGKSFDYLKANLGYDVTDPSYLTGIGVILCCVGGCCCFQAMKDNSDGHEWESEITTTVIKKMN